MSLCVVQHLYTIAQSVFPYSSRKKKHKDGEEEEDDETMEKVMSTFNVMMCIAHLSLSCIVFISYFLIEKGG